MVIKLSSKYAEKYCENSKNFIGKMKLSELVTVYGNTKVLMGQSGTDQTQLIFEPICENR